MKPTIGEQAPQFNAAVIGGQYNEETQIQLSDFIGQKVVLYFYPKDSTPGCTTQACDIRDRWSEISSKAVLFGISTDSIESHENFIQKKSLPFPLISDSDKSIATAYGVLGEKTILGKTLFAITERSTFIIDEQGKLSHILVKVNPSSHLDDVLASINN
ncbi:MAG: peroxiredoxin [Akkermansiaceae bacterium]